MRLGPVHALSRAALMKFAQQLVEVVVAAIVRGVGKRLAQGRGDPQLVVGMIDADHLPVVERGVRMAKNFIKSHGQTTIGARMSFTMTAITGMLVS